MATPALRAVRRDLPHTRIALMGGAHLEPLLADADLFDDWIATASGSGKVAANIAAIHNFGADVALLLPHSFELPGKSGVHRFHGALA